MFKSLTITNFQKHSKLNLKFDPKITTILGPSDVGKSAIIRALRWVCTNKPDGDGHIKEGKEFARVTLKYDDGIVVRSRGKKNKFKLNGQELSSFGRGVPDLVQRSLKVDQMNFQNQHDLPFWFCETGRSISERLNAIVDLSIVDEATTYSQKQVRSAKTETGVLKKLLDEGKAELETLSHVPKMMKAWEKLEKRTEKQKALVKRGKALRKLIESYREAEANCIDTETMMKEWSLVCRRRAESLTARHDWLELHKNIEAIKVHSEKKSVDFQPVEDSFLKMKSLRAKAFKLEAFISQIDKENRSLKLFDKRLRRLRSKLSICPTCSRPLEVSNED